MMKLMDLKNKEGLINEVVLFPLKVYRDKRGFLVEALKTEWTEVYGENRPFAQNYFSKTEIGVARDEDTWHVHKTKQEDRFVVVEGDIVVALFDGRKESSTYRSLNLIGMGEANGDNGQFLLLIPKNVLHCFCVISAKPAILLNYPTTLYDPDEEGRIPFAEAGAKLADGREFSWKIVREELGL